MRTSIATVCLSGTLVEKLHAAASAGFDGVEVFEPDLVASPSSPEEVAALARRLGLSLDLYQPFRDAEGVTDAEFESVLHRARAKFELMQRLGIDTMLVCSNVGTATIDDDAVAAAQLRRLGEEAEAHGVRLAYEALAWGRYVDDYRHAWRIVELADHPAVGICLDSFHILSRGHDPAAIEQIPGDKIFFLQLADAPALSMDVLSWSRHHRLFPGEGAFDLGASSATSSGPATPARCRWRSSTTPSARPTSVARPTTPSAPWPGWRTRSPGSGRTASAGWTASRPAPPGWRRPAAFDFVEVKAEDTSEVGRAPAPAGPHLPRPHRTKPVRLWSPGERAGHPATSSRPASGAPTLAAVGFEVTDAAGAAERARELAGPRRAFRRTHADEEQLSAFRAPDGTEVFLAGSADGMRRLGAEFERGERAQATCPTGHRPRQPRPPLAGLRRSGAVLQQRARRCSPTGARGRRAERSRPQPGDAQRRRRRAAARCTSRRSRSTTAATRNTSPSPATTSWRSPEWHASAGCSPWRSRTTTTTT